MGKFNIFKTKYKIMKKILFLLIFLLPLSVYAFNETEAIQRPVQFASGILDGIFGFLGQTIGWFALLVLALGFAVLILGVGKNVSNW